MRPVTRLLLAIAPVAAAAILGNIATIPNIPGWYAALSKPSFNPPNWLFGPVWALLYIAMAYAFFRILSVPEAFPERRGAIGAFMVQIILNGMWSWAFFGAHSPIAGLIVISALLLAIALTIKRFHALDDIAGWLLWPYLAWVGFAAILNASIWWLN